MPIKASTSEFKEEVAVIAPDGGWGWFVVAGTFICSFVVDGSIMTFGIFIDEIGKTFNEHPTVVGWAHSLITGFSALLGPFICGLVNQYGFKMVGFAGGIIASGAFLVSTFVDSIAVFIVVLGLFGGMGIGMISLPAVVVVGYYFNKWRNLASALAVTGSALGVVVFPIVLDNLLARNPWTIKFIFITISCVMCSVASLLFRPLKPVRVLVTQDEKLVEILTEVESFSMTSLPTISATESAVSQLPPPVERPMDREDIFLTVSMFSFSGLGLALSRSRSGPPVEKRRGSPSSGFSSSSFIDVVGPSVSIIRPSVKSMPSRPSTLRRTSTYVRAKYHCKDSVATIFDMMTRMLHCKLLKSISFCLMLLSIFVSALGMYAPYLFLKERAKEIGVTKGSNLMFTSLGIANVVGRITTGLASFIPGATPLNVSYISISICGTASILSIFCREIYTQHIYYAVFGLTSASLSSLRVPILVDILGIENLTNGYGLTLFVCGTASFLGAPIAGAIAHATNSYNSAYIFSGCMFILSAMFLMPIRAVYQWEERKNVLSY